MKVDGGGLFARRIKGLDGGKYVFSVVPDSLQNIVVFAVAVCSVKLIHTIKP